MSRPPIGSQEQALLEQTRTATPGPKEVRTDVPPAAIESGPKPLALIVEDEPSMCHFLRLALVPHGYRLVDAATGSDALLQAAAHVPDFILLDFGLPNIDGIEVIKQLRERSTTPIIVISARGQQGEEGRALDAGADDYLTKPLAPWSLWRASAPPLVALLLGSARSGGP